MHLHNLTIKKFHEGLLKKEFSALEITKKFFEYIETKDKEIGAYLSLAKDQAYLQAEQADLKLAKGENLGVLAGVPLAIKDNILVEGQPMTCASKMLENYRAPYDATVIKKLKAADVVFLGKTNMDEFAMGSSTENSAFKTTRNPHDLERVPGGSSGGSAAAVAAHMALGALGTDMGGSIRQPASLCGVVGLKPTYGAVSRYGDTGIAPSLDQIGPFAKTVEDAAIMFKTIAGKDQFDATSSDGPTDVGLRFGDRSDELLNPKLENIKGLKIGLPEEYFASGTDPVVVKAIEEAITKIRSLGIEFKKIKLPHTKYALSCYYIIMPAEASANLARFDGIRYSRIKHESDITNLHELYKKNRSHGFGPEVKRRIILGTYVLSSGYYDAYYAKAQKVRALIKKDFDEAFKEVDVILTPTAPTPAFKFGEKTADPLTMYLSDVFTIPANMAGLPAISIPTESRIYADFTRTNPSSTTKLTTGRGADQNSARSASSLRKSAALPIGFQLIGKHWRETDILGIGQYYEKLD